jgi:cobalt-zinc-cadmium efflux system outer membrane protein
MACLAMLATASVPVCGQQDSTSPQRNAIIEFPNLGPIPGTTEPALGPGPGSLVPSMNTPAGIGVVGGRRRTSRMPRGGKGHPGATSIAASRGMNLPETIPVPIPQTAVTGPATAIDETILDDEGPANGLTLDAAIDRVMAANLDIRALRHELTQADADILTAGLRTNPLVYMDTQFIPYGTFNNQRPGGPTQYDLNITYPLDISQKRQARTVVARMARSTLESQFQDIARRQIDTIYRGFVNLHAARLGVTRAGAEVNLQRANGFDDVYPSMTRSRIRTTVPSTRSVRTHRPSG